MRETFLVTIKDPARRSGAIILALIASVLIAGCAQRDRASDEENRSGGFYGGISGGLSK
jgi:hypothetical protein